MFLVKVLISFLFFTSGIVIKLSPADYYNKLTTVDNYILLDVRLYDDYCKSHILNAISAPDKETLLSVLSGINNDIPIFIYCENGQRTKQVAEILKDLNFLTIYDLEDGFINWVNQGFPVDYSTHN